MSKYLDFIGQQISQTRSAEGSQNEDLLPTEESGVLAQVKKHGLKVAGGLVAVAGGVLAYKHFTKPSVSAPQVGQKTDADQFIGQMLELQEPETKPTKIHDFTSRQDAEEEGLGQEFDQFQERLEMETPSMQELMGFDEEVQTDDNDFMKEMLDLQDSERKPTKIHDFISRQDAEEEGRGQEFDQYQEHLSSTSGSIEELFGLQMSGQATVEEDEDDQEGSAAMDLPGADLFSGATLKNPSMIPQIEGKFK